MKKILYLLFFVTIFLFNFININAEEDYIATAQCYYANAYKAGFYEEQNLIVDIEYNLKTNDSKINLSWADNKTTPPLQKGSNLTIYNFTTNDGKELKCPLILYTVTATVFDYTGLTVYSTKYLTNDKNEIIKDFQYGNSFEATLDETKSIIHNVEYTPTDNILNCNYYGLYDLVVPVKINLTKKILSINQIEDGYNIYSFTDYQYTENITSCPEKIYIGDKTLFGKYEKISFEDFSGAITLTFGMNQMDADEVGKEYENRFPFSVTGDAYIKLLEVLKPAISALSPLSLNIPLVINGDDVITLDNGIEAKDGLCSGIDCIERAEYYTEKGLRNIRSYCNTVYEAYPNYKNDTNMKSRMNECAEFNSFYGQLVTKGIINDLGDGCGIIPDKMVEKLELILNILKVAGPLIALGLGTFDFIKVIANGDADKEMKTAFKRFLTRIGAAALLFLIPLILAFLLDIFMRPSDGYNSDNPFCIEIDWDE